MERIPEELNLSESYHFPVTVENNETAFRGELSLSPDGCFLTVMGDISKDRAPEFDLNSLNELTCECVGGKIVLLGLKGIEANFQYMFQGKNPASHFEIKYKVAYAIYSRAFFDSNTGVVELELNSASIAQWVGYTETQDDIIYRNMNGRLFPFSGNLPSEFEQSIDNVGSLRIVYHPSTFHSIEEFSIGLRYSPSLTLSLVSENTLEQSIEKFGNLDALMSFLIGRTPDLDSVKLTTARGRMYSLSLYFPRAKTESKPRSYPLFPLGRNLRVESGLPAFPVESFSKYFHLAPESKNHFKKFSRYRDLKNPEERFLGFFRLLEKLCFVKESFLPEEKFSEMVDRVSPYLIRQFGDKKNVLKIVSKIKKANESKMNTAGCINKFLKTFSKTTLAKWIYGITDIEGICKLRNDLTHANDIEMEEYEIDRKAKFIEILLITRLLLEIAVPVCDGEIIASRVDGGGLIEKPINGVRSKKSD